MRIYDFDWVTPFGVEPYGECEEGAGLPAFLARMAGLARDGEHVLPLTVRVTALCGEYGDRPDGLIRPCLMRVTRDSIETCGGGSWLRAVMDGAVRRLEYMEKL